MRVRVTVRVRVTNPHPHPHPNPHPRPHPHPHQLGSLRNSLITDQHDMLFSGTEATAARYRGDIGEI